MRKTVLIFACFVLLFASCEDEESCQSTEQNPKSFKIRWGVEVYYPSGLEVDDAYVTITFQKVWCDGDYSIVSSHTEYTDEYGLAVDQTSYTTTLENDLDYIQGEITVQKEGYADVKEAFAYYYKDINVGSSGLFIMSTEITLE